MFHGGGEEKSSSVAPVGEKKANWRHGGCVNERICGVSALLLGGLGWMWKERQ